MAGTGEPELIIEGASSPHTHSMRPSDARAVARADVVFLVHELFEASLHLSVETLVEGALVIELAEADGLVLKPVRSGGNFEEDKDHVGHGEHSHDEDGHHSHDADLMGVDLHVWTDPGNAAAMGRQIARVLAGADPENADAYLANSRELTARLDDLSDEIQAAVTTAQGKPFVVFHDAFRYFEDRFGLTAVGSIVVNPSQPPGVRRIRELRQRVSDLMVVCAFREPQFDERIVETVVEGSSIRMGTVDPLGVGIEEGPELYFSLIRNMSADIGGCLNG